MFGAVILACLLLYFLYYHFVEKRRHLPPGPIPLPLVGNILSLGNLNQHKTINKWSQKYGPVFTLWIGSQPNLVITDYKILTDTLQKQGEAYAGRPEHFIFDDLRGGHQHGVFDTYGYIQKQQRRFALHVFRDFGLGSQIMEEKIMREVHKLVGNLDQLSTTANGDLVSVVEPLELCVANVVSSLLMGHVMDLAEFHELTNLVDSIMQFRSSLRGFLIKLFPWVRFIPLFEHFGYDIMCQFRETFFELIGRQIERNKGQFDPDVEATNYTSAFLKEMYTRGNPEQDVEGFTMWELNVAILDIWIAGMETTYTTLKWGLLYLVHNPEVQEKCHQEISQILNSREGNVITMADKNDAPFLVATIAEIQRCANVVPVNAQHQLTKDVVLNGFCLPRGLAVLPQMSSVMSSEKYFPSPERFDPRRFLEEDGRTLKSTEHVVPFSMGKRGCLGESLARMELFLLLATVIHKFRLSVPLGVEMPTVVSKPGFIRTPHPYKVLLEKRSLKQ